MSEVWQTMKEKRLRLITVKLNTILYWLLLQKTSTAHRKSKLFILKKEQSTKSYTKKKKKKSNTIKAKLTHLKFVNRTFILIFNFLWNLTLFFLINTQTLQRQRQSNHVVLKWFQIILENISITLMKHRK